MKTDLEIISNIITNENSGWFNTINVESAAIIKSKISEIPTRFYEPRITIDEATGSKISLLEFSLKIAKMSSSSKNKLMKKYNIDPYDMEKLQSIIDNIKVVSEYGSLKENTSDKSNEEGTYGIALSDKKQLDKAYPLWIAYLYADSETPYEDIKIRLIHDGTDDKYTPEYIVGLIEHTNLLLMGKTISEKKDFFISSISDILDEGLGIDLSAKDEVEF